MKRAAFRCRKTWVHAGEKCSKYYFSLEKRNYCNKTMYMVKKRDGMLSKDYRDILNEQFCFYKDLYTGNESVLFTEVNRTTTKLDMVLCEQFEGDISIAELFDVMMTLRPRKTPGGDSLILELYRAMWNDIKIPLFNNYQASITKKRFNQSARRGIINLIPKKNKEELLVSNWRPITLLNVDYKIWAKAIANRLESATDLISLQQTGFIKNRSIFTNILTTMEVITYLQKKNLLGLIVTVDFEKCFDHVEYQSIKGAFTYFGFGPKFIDMMFLLFSNLEMCTSSHGYLSEVFAKTRGCNQGCCASLLIFSFCREIMAHLIKGNDEIRGIDINGIKQILSQFADDTAIFLTYNKLGIGLEAFVKTMQHIEAQMGLKVSYEKTTIYHVGSLCNTEAKLITQRIMKWSNDPIELLGVQIACDGGTVEQNFLDVLEKVRNTCDNWFNRQATIYGKILIINVLMGSLFVYKMSTMLNLTPVQIRTVEQLFHNFIWSGKKAKISLYTLQRQKYQGGLRLTDLQAKQDAIKVSWIFKLNDNNPFLARCAYKALDWDLKEKLWKCNLCLQDVWKEFIEENFWCHMLFAWCKINYRNPQSCDEMLEQCIWFNSNIKVGGKVIKWKHWIDKDIMVIKDLLNCEGARLSAQELNVNWLELETISNNFPPVWKLWLVELSSENECLLDMMAGYVLYDKICALRHESRNRFLYDMFIADDRCALKYATRWRESGIEVDIDKYLEGFKILHECTKISKFRDFQYRLLLDKVTLNAQLKEWGVVDNDMCTFCNTEMETPRHIFYRCLRVRPLIEYFYDLCWVGSIDFSENEADFLFCTFADSMDHILNFVNIFLKQYVYSARCQNKQVNISEFIVKLQSLHDIELSIAKGEN